MPYKNIVITPTKYSDQHTNQTSQFYRGFSTVDESKTSPKLFDYELIKQDILNQFNTQKGERVMNPDFGTIIWALIYDPLTDELKQAVVDDVNRILQYDPRAVPVEVNLVEQPYGLLLECTLSFVGSNQVEILRLSFDKEIGLIAQQ
jgi:phage baseplate assembly protein W